MKKSPEWLQLIILMFVHMTMHAVHMYYVVLGSITLVYGITNLEWYSVIYGIWSSKIAQRKLYR